MLKYALKFEGKSFFGAVPLRWRSELPSHLTTGLLLRAAAEKGPNETVRSLPLAACTRGPRAELGSPGQAGALETVSGRTARDGGGTELPRASPRAVVSVGRRGCPHPPREGGCQQARSSIPTSGRTGKVQRNRQNPPNAKLGSKSRAAGAGHLPEVGGGGPRGAGEQP